MPKIDIGEVPPVLQALKVDNTIVGEAIAALEKVIKELKDSKDSKDKRKNDKNEHVIILSDPEGKLDGLELTGWVTVVKEGTDVGTVVEKIVAGIREFNGTKRGQKNPILTIGEGIAHVTRKFFTNQKVQVKTKEPVRVILTNNRLQ